MDLEARGASAPLHEAGLGLALERELGVTHRVELLRHKRSGRCFPAHLTSRKPVTRVSVSALRNVSGNPIVEGNAFNNEGKRRDKNLLLSIGDQVIRGQGL